MRARSSATSSTWWCCTNTPADFAGSPKIQVELDELPYSAGIRHSQAITALLQHGELRQRADILLGAGLYEELRQAAVEEVI